MEWNTKKQAWRDAVCFLNPYIAFIRNLITKILVGSWIDFGFTSSDIYTTFTDVEGQPTSLFWKERFSFLPFCKISILTWPT